MGDNWVKATSLPTVKRGSTPMLRFSDLRKSMLPLRPGADRGDLVAVDVNTTLVLTLKAAPTAEESVLATLSFPITALGVAERRLLASETDRAGTFYATATLVTVGSPTVRVPGGNFLWKFEEVSG